jgi:hypothetical protein
MYAKGEGCGYPQVHGMTPGDCEARQSNAQRPRLTGELWVWAGIHGNLRAYMVDVSHRDRLLEVASKSLLCVNL